MILPKPQLILDYKMIFGEEPPNRISLIKHISRKFLLFEITALNYRLKSKTDLQFDTRIDSQLKELRYFSMLEEVYKYYFNAIQFYTEKMGNTPIIFNRQACVFSLEEIINSNEIEDIENFDPKRIEVWEGVLKYILAVNYEITKIKEDDDKSFESLNPKLLPLNELSVEVNPIYTAYRGYKLMEYFITESILSKEIANYFTSVYGCEADCFIFQIISKFFANEKDNSEHEFHYNVREEGKYFFEIFSKSTPNAELYKLLSIRKSPFVKIEESQYLLVDNSFLIEKTYSQFLNDFWFDYLKILTDENGKGKYKIDFYRSIFGLFFEKYVSEIMKGIFQSYRFSSLLMFNDLKFKIGNKEIEIADLYFRYNNKILLGQVKSGNIYDKEKYGGDIEALYKNDRVKFFENFGVNQLVGSIISMNEYIKNIDKGFPQGHTYFIYPCIVINDKAFQTPFMADVFNSRFQELIKDVNIRKIGIKPLTLIHISDLERLEECIKEKPQEIWRLLEYNFRDKTFTPPFYNTIDRLQPKRAFPKKALELFRQLIKKYNPAPQDL